MTRYRQRRQDRDTFWRLQVGEVQALATQRLGRRLTPQELYRVENTFSADIGWHQVLCLAVDAVKEDST